MIDKDHQKEIDQAVKALNDFEKEYNKGKAKEYGKEPESEETAI